jgi:hypothetical protein
MELITNNPKDVDSCVKEFRNLVESEYRISTIFETLDEVIFEYTKYILKDECICGGSHIYSDQIELLKTMRDLFVKND